MQVEFSQISQNFEKKISVNLFSKAKTALVNAIGEYPSVPTLAPAYV